MRSIKDYFEQREYFNCVAPRITDNVMTASSLINIELGTYHLNPLIIRGLLEKYPTFFLRKPGGFQ